MNHEKNPARSRTILRLGLCLAAAILMTGIILGASYLNVSAEHYVVTQRPDETTYFTEDGIQVYPFNGISDTGDVDNWLWEVQSLTVGENQDTYQDAEGNWYYPMDADSFTVTLKAVDDTTREGLLLAPTSVESATVTSCTVEEGGTTLVIETTTGFPAITSIKAREVPDGNDVVENDTNNTDRYYHQTDSGLFEQMPQLRIEEPMVDDFAPGQLYEQSTEGTSLFYGWFIPDQLELTLTDDYIFITDVLPQVTDSQGDNATVEFRDEHTLVLSSTDWTGVTDVQITGLSTAALNGTVWEVTGTEGWLYPVGAEFADWTVIANGTIYQDAAGNQYVPTGTYNLTLKREGYWLPTEGTSLYSTRFESGTTLIYTGVTVTESGGQAVLPITPPTVEAQSAPDESSRYAAQGMDGDWYYSQDGALFETMPVLRMERVPNASLSSEDLYGLYFWQVDGNYAFGQFVPGTTVTLTAASGYGFGPDNAVRDYPDAVTVTDARTITIDTSGMEGKGEVVMDMDIREDITITFTSNDYFSTWVDYEEVSSVQWPQGVDLDLSFHADSGLYQVDWTTAITGATVSVADTGGGPAEPLDIDLTVNEYGDAVLPGDVLTGDCTITFTVHEDAFIRLVTVPETSGDGYTLTCTRGAVPGEPGSISLRLTVDFAYSESTPVLTPPEGWSIDYMGNELNVWWYITMDYGDGETDPVPADPMELTVGVSGIVPNDPGGGDTDGGGGGGWDDDDDDETTSTPEPSPSPSIRVENELDEEDASSDTRLWPAGTVEEGGVSTTTVTDEELEALLDLARKHAEDAEQLEGDGYKEGIIVIEDLSPDSDNQTYILELTDTQFQRISGEEWDRFTVETPAGSMSLYGDTIQETAQREGAVSFTLTRLEHEGRPGVDATLTVDGEEVTVFTEAYGVRIFVPYTPAEGEDTNAIVVEYIHEDGTVELVTECYYDPTAGGVYFFTTHLSKFGVAYRPAVFEDVGPDHWANPYVTFLASRGVITGYQGGLYRPDEPATRGEFLSLLTSALSVSNLPTRAVQVYSDVPTSSYLAKTASWVYFNNLAGGTVSGGLLRPNEAITRQDMAALLSNIGTGVGLRLRSRGLDTGYTDLNEVAAYASGAVIRLRAAGILEMPDNYKFYPKSTLNRGEMAQIVATLLSNL